MANAARTIRREMQYEPRPLQRQVHAELKRFNSLVFHRRFGKTVLSINQMIYSGLQCKKTRPQFGYFAPLRNQAKAVAWEFLKEYSQPFRDEEPNIAELRVDLFNSCRIQLFGADNPDAIRGMYFDGVVFDEFGDMDPTLWTRVVRPLLADRKGWAIFIGTPKGKNAFYDLHQAAIQDDEWYARTFKASETDIIIPSELTALRKAMTPEEYEQEFECSFLAPNIGAYYGKEMASAEDDKRICSLPWEASVPVHTAWDLGIDDATSIWFCQQVGHEVRLIDYYENSGEGLAHYANVLRGKPYVYGEHLLPHDAAVKELGTGRSRVEVLDSLGIRPTPFPPGGQPRVEDGINAVRMLLPKCWFDRTKCEHGIKALGNYQREWSPKLETWRSAPRHDKWSHGADSFRYLAERLPRTEISKPLKYNSAWIV